jgi:SAM-dependent methyltransferase
VSPQTGYAEWADSYDDTVAEGLDRPLLNALQTIEWTKIRTVADLACGTGRIGVWLREHGVHHVDGVDITREMLQIADRKHVYRHLRLADVACSGLADSSYDLCTLVLADEHLAELAPVYREAERLLTNNGVFILIGYHPFFLISGVPTHYHRRDKTPIAIECHIHLFSEHFQVGMDAGLKLTEFREQLIEEDWLRHKPKWREYLNTPVSFALVWRA